MNRAWATLWVLLLTAGCQLPPERLAVRPLPEDGQPLPYAELITRARLQTTAATEAFYVDRWAELEEAAGSLEQTSRWLNKATAVPARHKDDLAAKATGLNQEAVQLQAAARARDVKLVNEVLQRINLKVRELRPEN